MNHYPAYHIRWLITLVLSVWSISGYAQFAWPDGRKAAVCLTYDDGLDHHLDIVLPQLDSLGFKATFYVPGSSGSLGQRLDEWREIVCKGHELGNHSLFHPCHWKTSGMNYTNHYELADYTFKQLMDELRTANTLLKAIDGKDRRTYAYTCSHYTVEGIDFSDSLRHLFTAARCNEPMPENMEGFDFYKTHSWCVGAPHTAEDMISFVERARELGTIAIFMFHDIGGDPDNWFNLNADKHRTLLRYLKEHEADYYISTFMEVTDYIRMNEP